MPKLKQSPVIYLSRIDWSHIVTAPLARAGVRVDKQKFEDAMKLSAKEADRLSGHH